MSHRSFCSELLSIPCPVFAHSIFLLGVDRHLNASLAESHPTFSGCFLSLSRSWHKDKTAKGRRQSRNHFPWSEVLWTLHWQGTYPPIFHSNRTETPVLKANILWIIPLVKLGGKKKKTFIFQNRFANPFLASIAWAAWDMGYSLHGTESHLFWEGKLT